MANEPRFLLVAGEASGDIHGASLVRQLKKHLPGSTFSGIGGEAMAEAGVEILYGYEELAVMGFSDVLPKLAHILSILSGLKKHMRQTHPDVVILIDFPDFNFRVGKAAKKMGLKVLYYISPQLWAWRQGRAKTLAKFSDHLACVFPFEQDFYQKIAPDMQVTFVGHPFLDRPPDTQADEPLPFEGSGPVVGLLPGSRVAEVERLLPLLLEAATIMQSQAPDLRFVMPIAPGLSREKLAPYMGGAPEDLLILQGQAERVMRQADLLLITSGTATLQAALAGAPMVVVYKTGGFNFWLASSLVKVDHIAMPNLIYDGDLLPELVQDDATAQTVAAEGMNILNDSARRQAMIQGLDEVRQKLGGPGANARTAELVMQLMEESRK